MAPVATKLAFEEHGPPPSPFTDLVLSAKLELYACLQLLSERVRFVTGAGWAAIALVEGQQLVYRASTGRGAPEIGTDAELNLEYFRSSQPVVHSDKTTLTAAVFHDWQAAGVIQLRAENVEFTDQDIKAVTRIAEMVSAAIAHMEAAEHSHEFILSISKEGKPSEVVLDLGAEELFPQLVPEQTQEMVPTEVKRPAKQATPLLWHAPEGAPAASTAASATTSRGIAPAVRLCESCGFPVSPGRKVCMDCEERGRVSSRPAMFNTEPSASWISTHAYTIASLLLPALAAALFYWLRLR